MLTSDQLAHYREYGYIVLKQFVALPEVDWLRREVR
tara:strand:+ start:139 stop:246 length:108 start_codon:yes stop_codon:yes gene_type:complete